MTRVARKVGITDSLFVTPAHEALLAKAGLRVERLPHTAASEDQLIGFLQDKDAYILGGNEVVTERVIDACKQLKIIAHCGTAYQVFIPAWRYATQKGIAITNVPDGHTHAVAEWAVAAALSLNRNLLAGNNTPNASGMGLEGRAIGILGLGRIGARVAEMLQPFRPKQIRYYSTNRHQQQERSLGLAYGNLAEVVQKSDVLFLCIGTDKSTNFFSHSQFARMKPGALLVSVMPTGVINPDALYDALQAGAIRAVSDYPMDARFERFTPLQWYSSAIPQAFNTRAGIRQTSQAAIRSVLNFLATGSDRYIVNPGYKETAL
jgi:phosphoglycerate dehydrogenase-like enzyme